MPRYFFHLRDDRFTPDEFGEELKNNEAADRHVLRLSGDILHDSVAGSSGAEVLSVVCTDAAGAIVSAVTVSRPSLETARHMLAAWQGEPPG